MWQLLNPNISPIDAATRFIDAVYPGREIQGFNGKWIGREFSGSFMMRDGVAEYTIKCDRCGRYEVDRV